MQFLYPLAPFVLSTLLLALTSLAELQGNALNDNLMYGLRCSTKRPGAPGLQYSDCAKVFAMLYNDPIYEGLETYDRDNMPLPWSVPPSTRFSRQNPCIVELRSNLAEVKERISVRQIFYAATEIMYHCRDHGAGGLAQVGTGKGFHVTLRAKPTYQEMAGTVSAESGRNASVTH